MVMHPFIVVRRESFCTQPPLRQTLEISYGIVVLHVQGVRDKHGCMCYFCFACDKDLFFYRLRVTDIFYNLLVGA